jgi:hypothetical protein
VEARAAACAARARPYLVPHRHGGAHRDAETRAHQLLDGLLVAQLHDHARPRAAAPEPAVDDPADGAAPLVDDEWVARQLGRGEAAAPRPLLGRRAHRHQWVEQERRHHELAARHRQRDDRHVQLVVGHRRRDLGSVAGHHDQLELRVARPQAPEQRRQQVDARDGARPQPQPPRHHAAELAEGFLRGLQLREGAAGVLQQQRPRRGGEGALAHALEQRGAAARLELAHVQTHRGLAQVQALGRA